VSVKSNSGRVRWGRVRVRVCRETNVYEVVSTGKGEDVEEERVGIKVPGINGGIVA
jgi:hypothetical protein